MSQHTPYVFWLLADPQSLAQLQAILRLPVFRSQIEAQRLPWGQSRRADFEIYSLPNGQGPIRNVTPRQETAPTEEATSTRDITAWIHSVTPTMEVIFRFLSHAIESKGLHTVTREIPVDPTYNPALLSEQSIEDTVESSGGKYLEDNNTRISWVCTACDGPATTCGRFVLS